MRSAVRCVLEALVRVLLSTCLLMAGMAGCAAPEDKTRAEVEGADGGEGGLDEDRPLDTAPDRAQHADLFTDDTLQPAVLAAIESAGEQVDVAQYTIWDGGPVDALVDALAAAAERGVAVRVLADETASGVDDVLETLALAGASTQLDSPERTTHNKLWIIDGVVISGSHNLSWSALETNREVSLRTAEPEAVAAVQGWFDRVWEDPSGLHPVSEAGIATDTAAFSAHFDCIEGAQERVHVAMYAVAWDERYPGSTVDLLLGALEAAVVREVEVRVLLDDSEWIADNGINDAAEARLLAAGVPLRRAHAAEVVHAKTLVCDELVVVSDANWSYSGLELYHGATIAREGPELAAAALDWMDGLWVNGREP